ncbi:M48 family metalloprotease [Spirochaeta africana]|uniref:Peptidase family M48 n=1 Tax=Spirochaeta africana (strain ATCC 700263 / DSM 8902 / Z-7692) TaxID=889378 RepID=H9ULT4_SPIAZ|nr:M48 family metalloprotease [Spirochaeta africana]AFG38477.1 Peptidase family M48 [Spirochaeta africana DSM 8902]
MTINRTMQIVLASAGLCCLFLLPACTTATDIGTRVGQAAGVLDARQAEGIRRTAERTERSFEDFTPEQEYFLGRSVAAQVLDRYPVYDDEQTNGYISLIGQSLAVFSDRPDIFAGYSFQILDSEELNAFATPGGHVFVTLGMLRLARNEDEVAAILAHEIAHITEAHGLQSIRTARITGALTSAAITGVYLTGSREVAELTDIFSDSIDDMSRTLFTSGYSRTSEREADRIAVTILRRAGYSPHALVTLLQHMGEHWNPQGRGYARTHPSPLDRMQDVQDVLDDEDPRIPEQRIARFQHYLGGL